MDQAKRHRRRVRIRARVIGTAARPRASVFRSARAVSVQLIDDERGHTLLSSGGKPQAGKTKTVQAETAGSELAALALKLGIKRVVFDRGGYSYHGRVRAVAEAMRRGGLEF